MIHSKITKCYSKLGESRLNRNIICFSLFFEKKTPKFLCVWTCALFWTSSQKTEIPHFFVNDLIQLIENLSHMNLLFTKTVKTRLFILCGITNLNTAMAHASVHQTFSTWNGGISIIWAEPCKNLFVFTKFGLQYILGQTSAENKRKASTRNGSKSKTQPTISMNIARIV